MKTIADLVPLPPVQAPAPDTVVMMMPRDGLATAEAVASIVVAAGLVILFLLVGVLVLQVRRLGKTLERQADPVMDRARSVAENVEFITASVRTDIQKLNESVGRISDRLNQASDRVEERIEDFNALMEVVQGEAEDIFLDTAATVRGVRAGAYALQQGETPQATGPEALPGDTSAASLEDEPESVDEAGAGASPVEAEDASIGGTADDDESEEVEDESQDVGSPEAEEKEG